MNTTVTRVCWAALLISVSVLLVVVAISFQYLASSLIAMDGFGNGPSYACSRCNALVHDVDGVYFPNHWFHVRHRHWLNTGTIGCAHQWQKKGSGHADGSFHPWHRPLLKTSHVLFWCAGLVFLTGAIGGIWSRTKHCTLLSRSRAKT